MPHPSTSRRSKSTSTAPSDSENTPPTLNANMSRAELLKIARQFEVAKNTAQSELKHLSRKLADITNDNDNENDDNQSGRRSKHRRVVHEPESSPEDSDEEHSADTSNRMNERFVLQAGHKFGLIYSLWVHSGDEIFDEEVDQHYTAAERFENDHNKSQGQLHEILDLVQIRFEQRVLRQRWFRRQFIFGLNSQRYNTATRVRRNCASILGVDQGDLLTSEVRKAKFRQEIGWVADAGTYSSVDVPILHKNWHGEYSLSSIFLNPKLMGIYVSLIRGPQAGIHFMKGESMHPQTETMARIHNIRNITPGAIAICSVMVRWALSGDDILQEVGSITGIHYFNDYEEYLTILETGLRQKKKSILNIIKQWNEKIFPDYDPKGVKDESSGLKKAMDLLEADSEEEEDQLVD